MRRVLPCLLLAVVSGPAAAQPGVAVKPEHYFTLKAVTELAVSPDGTRVAYCLATWDEKANNRKTDLWVVPTDGQGKPRQLTSDRANDRNPKWSADGKSVYVLGNRKAEGAKPPRDGTAQVWKVPVDGGDVTAVTKVSGGVSGFDYAPAADAIVYAIDVEVTDEADFSKLRAKYDTLEYGHGKRKVSEVFRLGKGGAAEKVISERRYVREMAVTADGKRVAMVTAFDDSVLKSEGESRVDVWEAGKVVTPPTGVYRKNAASPWAWLESLAWSPDGKRFAFCAIFDAYPAEIIVGEEKGGAWDVHRAPRKDGIQVRGYGSPLRWNRNDFLIAVSDYAGANGLLFYNPERREMFSIVEEGNAIYAIDALANGEAPLLVRGSSNRFPEVEAGVGKDRVVLTDLNPQTRGWALPTVQHITWKAPDGVSVGGVLELPKSYQKGQKLPLVVAIHGGPTTSTKAALEFDPHNGRLYFSAAGYAVLLPNYRGSTGYGDKFVTDLIGNENDVEVKDILAGIQHLIADGIADPDRVAVMGWSNGGYLTNCLISLKDSPVNFKAASSGAGIVDTVAEWGFNDEPAYPRVFKKGLPWETPDTYRKTSPTYQLGNVRTPTLIHVGGNDERCPPGHSRMLYRALKEYVNVPTQLVVYPGEPHGLTKYTNRQAKMEWDLAWFDKYVMGK